MSWSAAWAKISGASATKPVSTSPAWKAWSIGGPPRKLLYSTEYSKPWSSPDERQQLLEEVDLVADLAG